MNGPMDDRKQATSYLLGQLPDAEQVLVEERSFQDHQFSDLISEVEDDLVDEYVRGALPEHQRQGFERHYLSSPRRHEKVAFARSFQKTDTTTASGAAARPRPTPAPSRLWAMAALLILALGGVWLTVEVARLRREVAHLRAQGRTPESPVASTPGAPETPGSPGAPVRPPVTVLAAFALSPGVRGAADAVTLTVPRGEGIVRLQLSPDAGDDDYPRYRAELRTAGGRPLWSEDGLVARRSGGETVVFADVPARLLGAGAYEIALEGVRGARRDALGDYPFKVAEP
jgi:hypothetical protein